MHTTPVSLLQRLRQGPDNGAWVRFVKLYTPLLFFWGKKAGLQPHDAADLAQDVFATLLQKLPEFAYKQSGSFRSWLRTVTMNHWRDRCKRRATRPIAGQDIALIDVAAPDQFQELADGEYRQQLVSRALQLMRADFQTRTWQAFWEHVVSGRTAPDVAKEMGLSPGAVYAAKFRVLERLRQELEGLLDG